MVANKIWQVFVAGRDTGEKEERLHAKPVRVTVG